MRLLVDANLSPRVAVRLAEAGHDAIHVADVGMLTASDLAIATHAAGDGRVLVTSDADFGTILARTGSGSPSVILLRHHNYLPPEDQLGLIETAPAAASDELTDGAIVTISRGRLRLRRLPIR